MKNSRTAVIVLILVGLLSIPAQAQVIPGRWDKLVALAIETLITVDLKSGDRIEGNFEGLSPSELSLRTGSAQAADLNTARFCLGNMRELGHGA